MVDETGPATRYMAFYEAKLQAIGNWEFASPPEILSLFSDRLPNRYLTSMPAGGENSNCYFMTNVGEDLQGMYIFSNLWILRVGLDILN